MAHSRWWSVLGGLSLLGALASGCAQNGVAGDPEAPGSAAAPIAEASEGDEAELPAHGRGQHGGPAALLRVALHELSLTEAQQGTIKEALHTLREGKGEHRAAPPGRPAVEALAAGVRAGKIDEAAVRAKLSEAEPHGDEARSRLATALQTLHATLTPEQRKQLVDAVAARADEHADHPGKGWKHGGDHDAHGKQGGALGPLLRGVELSDAQKEQLGKALHEARPADPEAHRQQAEAARKERQARLASFASGTFDARAFTAPPSGEGRGHAARLERMTRALAALVPTLDASQREKLASNLEQGPRAGHAGHGGRHRGHRGGQAPE